MIRLADLVGLEGLPVMGDVHAWVLNHPKFSPEGGRVAMRVTMEAWTEKAFILTANTDGSDPVVFQYTLNGQPSKPMHWNFYDDHHIYGYDLREEGNPCTLFDLKGQSVEVLHQGDGNHACLFRDKTRIATDSWYGAEKISIYEYKRGDLFSKPLTTFDSPVPYKQMLTHPHPAYSRDGKRIYFNHTGMVGGSQLCAINLS